MYRCKYCNRHLKKKYDKCPACGSNSFEKINNIGQYIIKTPPKDGYKVNVENYKIQKKPGKIILLIGVFILFYIIGFSSTFISFGSNEEIGLINIIFVLFGLFF